MNLPTLRHCALMLLAACGAAPLLQGCGGDAIAHTATATAAQAASPGRPFPEAVAGAWESNVTIQDCSTGAVLRTFKGLTLLQQGGGASATNNLPPAVGSPAYGSWGRAANADAYEIRLRFFRFNPDGSWAGAQNLTRTVMLLDSNTMTGTVSAQVLDAAGNILQTVCGSETASRVAAG
jgi:hypothetical protein